MDWCMLFPDTSKGVSDNQKKSVFVPCLKALGQKNPLFEVQSNLLGYMSLRSLKNRGAISRRYKKVRSHERGIDKVMRKEPTQTTNAIRTIDIDLFWTIVA
jgi:hypothetical protein